MSSMDFQSLPCWAKPELPCAACRLLHRRCTTDCMLAPYFPSDNSDKFSVVHKVFGASNVIKMLHMIEGEWREDAVKSMIYEAYARVRDPVHGCTTAIFYLQSCIEELQEQIQDAERLLLESQEQRNQLLCFLNQPFAPAYEEMSGGGGVENGLFGDSLMFMDRAYGFDSD
ncbi:LOB domain-containing protein 1-like [Phalaenopsis equestris]|uniref:LOB domain-containing protein 1-like n=1 Tax=Phalaenopsis equestris TaxID=78828 RepID=UPI0009E1E8FF|nr:LOB domain-containing protein 1-like [Phalaenopsis equestris]